MIEGRFFDGASADSTSATMEFSPDGTVRIHGPAGPMTIPLAAIDVSDRIANIPRRLSLPGGAVFETSDNEGVDRACAEAGVKLRYRFVHWLESRWPVAVASLVAVILLSAAFLRWGVPAIADWAAAKLPPQVDRAIGVGALDVLDQVAFYQSGLPAERQLELRARFDSMTRDLDDGHEYRLELRDGGQLGANAFALPSGIVVVTDQLVALANTDEELVAVLAHEIGHVRGRHTLRQLLQVAGVSAIAMALLGDVSSTSGVLTSAPALLHAKHSRDFEIEADRFAREWLRANAIEGSRFDDILCRMSASAGDHRELDFFASHPPTQQRADCTD